MPAAGSVVQVDITFRSSKEKMMIMRLTGTGSVLRIGTQDGQAAGFAAEVEFAIAEIPTSSNG